MVTLQRITTRHPHYPFAEELLHSAFPKEERRSDHAQRHNTDCNARFGCYLVTDEDAGDPQPVGIVTIWSLDGFHYVEHLATSPSVRNKGYGKEIMKQVDDLFSGLLILEVERPEDEITKRRIGFYKRCGLRLCEKPYLQPSYHDDGTTLPLLLMFKGAESIDDRFNNIRSEIYHHVYNCLSVI